MSTQGHGETGSCRDLEAAIEPPPGMSRREVLVAMAATAGAFALPTQALAAEVSREVAVTRRALRGAAYDPKVYSAHEWQTVRTLVDYIIPKDERSGSATDAAVPEFMDTMLHLEPGMRVAHRGGLAWLDHEMRRRVQKDFVTASDAERRALLDEIAFPARARPEVSHGVSWFNSFRDFTASGFFTSEIGVADLGYEGNTPVAEWTGCSPEAYRKLGV
jgi:gluconate 2-dehydrogenase gamma chain